MLLKLWEIIVYAGLAGGVWFLLANLDYWRENPQEPEIMKDDR